MSLSAFLFGSSSKSGDASIDTGWNMVPNVPPPDTKPPVTQSEPVFVEPPEHDEPVVVKGPKTIEKGGYVHVGDDDGFSVSGGTLVTVLAIPILLYVGWSYTQDFVADLMRQEASTPRQQFTSLVGLDGVDTSIKRQFKSLFSFLRADSLARRQFTSFIPLSTETSLIGKQMTSLVSPNEVTASATKQLRSLVFLKEVKPPTIWESVSSRISLS